MCVLLVFNAYDVEPIAALDQIAGLALGERKCGFLEFWNRATTANPSEFTAIFRADGVFRVLLRKLGEIPASLDLFEHVLGFLTRLFDAVRINLAIGTRQGSLYQNV